MAAVAVVAALVLGAVVLLAIYVLPTIIAVRRDISNKVPLLLVNLLLGWLGFAWIACLVWSIVEQSQAQRRASEREAAAAYDRHLRRQALPPLLPGGNGPAQWFFAAGASPSGPHTDAAMAHYAVTGQISADTLCWHPALGEAWRPLSQVRAHMAPPPLQLGTG